MVRENVVTLIGRLEKARKPSRALDTRIQCFIQGFRFISYEGGTGEHFRYETPPGTPPNALNGVRNYTESLDAAMSFLPKGHFVNASCLWPEEANNKISVVRASDDVIVGENNRLTTAPLAACIAILHAIILLEKEGG